MELTTVILAAMRLTQLAADDTVTAPLRDRLAGSDYNTAAIVLDVIGCPWCLTVWTAGIAAVLHRRAPAISTALAAAEVVGLIRAAGSPAPKR